MSNQIKERHGRRPESRAERDRIRRICETQKALPVRGSLQ